jgi:hypothetical protein
VRRWWWLLLGRSGDSFRFMDRKWVELSTEPTWSLSHSRG